MRVLVAGATGAIGKRLLPMLLNAGHYTIGMTHSPARINHILKTGAEGIAVDALDAKAVITSVKEVAPDVIIHELTALPALLDFRKFDEQFALTNRLRTEALDNLLAGARATRTQRIIAQSYAGWPFDRTGGPIKTEEDPLDPNPPDALRRTLQAIRYVESRVPAATGMKGIVLRYGALYGPGTSLGDGGAMLNEIRHRRVPLIGGGTAVWSFLHVDDAARATVAAISHGSQEIYNVVDDDPAPVSEWLPALARILEAKPPRRLPAWLGRLMIGPQGMAFMLDARGASNAKAKRELDWQPSWPSWKEGFGRGMYDVPQPVQEGARVW